MQDLAGWDDQPLSAFPDGTWQPVVPAPAVRVPDTALAPVQMPPVRIVETRRAVSIRKIDQVAHKQNRIHNHKLPLISWLLFTDRLMDII